MALALGQAAAAVQAEQYRGRAVGLYENRLRLTSGPSDEELIGRIEELFGKKMADEVANALGVFVFDHLLLAPALPPKADMRPTSAMCQ
jgi:hypothetical protein